MRGVTPLQNGDIISPIYPTYMSADAQQPDLDGMSTSWAVYNDARFRITWDGTQKVTQAELTDEVPLRLAFRLHDIFGGTTTTAMTRFSTTTATK